MLIVLIKELDKAGVADFLELGGGLQKMPIIQ
jgi:hypothetical protein